MEGCNHGFGAFVFHGVTAACTFFGLVVSVGGEDAVTNGGGCVEGDACESLCHRVADVVKVGGTAADDAAERYDGIVAGCKFLDNNG